MTVIERFLSHVNKTAKCWLWTASRHPKGYGTFCIPPAAGAVSRQMTRVSAHRFSYAHYIGAIPPDALVCHRCDNPPCVNPAHLFLGSPADNTRDMMTKGRSMHQTHPERLARGERTNTAKLTAAQVIEIRRRFVAGETHSVLSAEFGVSRAALFALCHLQSWKHIVDPTYVEPPRRWIRKPMDHRRRGGEE